MHQESCGDGPEGPPAILVSTGKESKVVRTVPGLEKEDRG
jgi:hypothetical protein